jgi:hypothetical protein
MFQRRATLRLGIEIVSCAGGQRYDADPPLHSGAIAPETNRRDVMGMIRIFALLAALLAMTSIVTEAVACPGGYVRCGGACCPGR